MTLAELQIGIYFRIPRMNPNYVYKKASNSRCTLGSALQPIRHETEVLPMTSTEVTDYYADYFSEKLNFLESWQHYEIFDS